MDMVSKNTQVGLSGIPEMIELSLMLCDCKLRIVSFTILVSEKKKFVDIRQHQTAMMSHAPSCKRIGVTVTTAPPFKWRWIGTKEPKVWQNIIHYTITPLLSIFMSFTPNSDNSIRMSQLKSRFIRTGCIFFFPNYLLSNFDESVQIVLCWQEWHQVWYSASEAHLLLKESCFALQKHLEWFSD